MRCAYVSGDPALDLVATVESRRHAPEDLLAGPADLEQWIEGCEALPDGVTADVAGLDSAVRLREALHRLALDRVADRPFAPAALATVNAAAAHPAPVPVLDGTGVRLTGDLRTALSALARSGIALLADRGTPVKECGLETCTRLYVDRSRGARRTWCGMESCGNRVKAAAYRARKQDRGRARA